MKSFLFSAVAITLLFAGADIAKADFGGFGSILKGATKQMQNLFQQMDLLQGLELQG